MSESRDWAVAGDGPPDDRSTRGREIDPTIDGYPAAMCILTRPAAEALARAQREFTEAGYALKVYDCYRPQRAVDDFARWAADPAEQSMKAEFYPRIDRSVEGLQRQGFVNYDQEWWHHTYRPGGDGEPYPQTYFDFPVDPVSLSRPPS